MELAVDVASHLLPQVSPQEVVERFSGELFRGLQHPQEKVRCLVLKQVIKSLSFQVLMSMVGIVIAVLLTFFYHFDSVR